MNTVTTLKQVWQRSLAKHSKGNTLLNSFSDSLYHNYSDYGRVNLENINDSEFEMVQNILKDTYSYDIDWQPVSIFRILKNLYINKRIILGYKAHYQEFSLLLESDIKDNLRLSIATGIKEKAILDTYISEIPFIINKKIGGTRRSRILIQLYDIFKDRVDGRLIEFKRENAL